ncbi:hypothetical protein [Morganella sp. EGD-HP17]|uniref:hypothetical protein n=1 Tax=Morganella sp. EGD-HP17 TaxID=1435146 RepID=UPI00044AECE9|nr:hypothetical protein [Morganella sp. EGD-HP17]ETO41272.1 hypothetical protein X965_10965 [Morganella sp. EGD-HP17]
MKMIKAIMIFFCTSFYALADVSVIGITINKDSREDVFAKYQVASEYGDVLVLNASEIPLEGVSSAVVALEDGKVKAVSLELNKNKFNYFYDLLNGKYKLVKKVIPHVGNKYASFAKDGVLVFLDSPHLSFKMELLYIDKIYNEELKNKQKKQDEDEKKQIVEQL